MLLCTLLFAASADAGDLIGIDTTIKVKNSPYEVGDDGLSVDGAVLTIRGSGGIRFTGSGDNALSDGGITVSGGDLEISGSSSLDIHASEVIISGGSILTTDSSTVLIEDSALEISGGDITFEGSGALILRDSSLSVSGGDVSFSDSAVFFDGVSIETSGSGAVTGAEALLSCDGRRCDGPELPDGVAVFSSGADSYLLAFSATVRSWDSLSAQISRTIASGTRALSTGVSVGDATLIALPDGDTLDARVTAALRALD